MGLELEFTEGLQFDKGYISPYFITDPERLRGGHGGRVRPGPPVQGDLIDGRLPAVAREDRAGGSEPLLVIAEDVEGEALATLVVNKIRGLLNVVAVKAPGFGDRRKQPCSPTSPALTGGTVISARKSASSSTRSGWKSLLAALGGSSSRRTPHHDRGRRRRQVGDRGPDQRRSAPRSRTPTPTGTRRSCRSGWPSCLGGVCILRVGAATEVELKEKKHRLEDAISATRAAIEEGIDPRWRQRHTGAPGRRSRRPRPHGRRGDRRAGRQARADRATRLDRALNAGQEGLRRGGQDRQRPARRARLQRRHRRIRRILVAQGVIDPVKVTRSAVQNAASIAGQACC